MKKQFVIIAVVLIAIASAAIALFYVSSFHSVTLQLQSDDMNGAVYRYDKDGGSTKVVPITTSQTIKLQSGDYGFVTDSADYNNTPTNFSVKATDQIIKIDTPYSDEYLSKLLDSESTAILAVIMAKYGATLSDFDVDRGLLLGKGEWYGTTFTEQLDQGRNPGDTYRVVLHKVEDKWVVAAEPSIVLTTKSAPDVPLNILTRTNDLNEL